MKLLICAVLVLCVVAAIVAMVRRSRRPKQSAAARISPFSAAHRSTISAPHPTADAGRPASQEDRITSLVAPEDEDDGKYWRRYYRDDD